LLCGAKNGQNPASMKTRVILAIVVAALTACTTGEKMSQIQPGMTTGQVTAILGHPDGFRQVGDVSYYQYSNRLASGWGWDKGDYEVAFRNGRVVSYGATGIRPNPVQRHTVTVTRF
jgi:outer membrane protein assembly factor BamE (lipoprotein component of BamABCDE complex)